MFHDIINNQGVKWYMLSSFVFVCLQHEASRPDSLWQTYQYACGMAGVQYENYDIVAEECFLACILLMLSEKIFTNTLI